jgi:hypothetical protein
MTAISLRAAHTAPSDRVLVTLGMALVRYGRARAERRARAIVRERAASAAERRYSDEQLRMLATVGAPR